MPDKLVIPTYEAEKRIEQLELEKQRQQVAELLIDAQLAMLKRLYRGTTEERVLVGARRKRITFIGCTHHLQWESCYLAPIWDDYAVTDTGRIAVNTQFAGPTDDDGRLILTDGRLFGEIAHVLSDTWQAVAIDRLRPAELDAVQTALAAYAA